MEYNLLIGFSARKEMETMNTDTKGPSDQGPCPRGFFWRGGGYWVVVFNLWDQLWDLKSSVQMTLLAELHLLYRQLYCKLLRHSIGNEKGKKQYLKNLCALCMHALKWEGTQDSIPYQLCVCFLESVWSALSCYKNLLRRGCLQF